MRARLEEFIQYRLQHLAGDEKGEAQVFLDRLFRAFGHGGVREAGAALEMRVARRDNRGTAFADLVWKPATSPVCWGTPRQRSHCMSTRMRSLARNTTSASASCRSRPL